MLLHEEIGLDLWVEHGRPHGCLLCSEPAGFCSCNLSVKEVELIREKSSISISLAEIKILLLNSFPRRPVPQ